MENIITTTEEQKQTLKIENEVYSTLKSTIPWANIIAVIGYLFAGITLALGIAIFAFSSDFRNYMPTDLGHLPFMIMGIVLVISAIVLFLPAFYTSGFANQLKKSLESFDQERLLTSLKNLKRLFIFNAIMYIIALVMYVLSFFGFYMAGAAATMMM